jgi:Tol biopolymer transport system component
MNPEGSDQKRLTFNSSSGLDFDGDPTLSPDGKNIAFSSSRDGGSRIYTMNADGSNKKQLTKNNDFECAPGWSPNGKKIVFESQRDPGNSEIYKIKPTVQARRG